MQQLGAAIALLGLALFGFLALASLASLLRPTPRPADADPTDALVDRLVALAGTLFYAAGAVACAWSLSALGAV